MTRDYSADLPDRNDTEIPEQVQWFLSVCELAVIWHEWLEDNIDTQKDKFCEGVVDYWWGDDLEEPHLAQVFRKPLKEDNGWEDWQGWPSKERVAYQKGAVVGYQLAERYRDERQT